MRNAMPAKTRLRRVAIFVLLIAIHFYGAPGQVRANQDVAASPGDGTVIKDVIDTAAGDNLLGPSAWRPWEEGFQREGDQFVCDNGDEAEAQRGASQTVVLNQTIPEPIIAEAWSKAEGVSGSPDSGYSLYLDLVYTDGTPLWGQVAPFAVGSHDWQRRQVVVVPEKPVRQVTFHMLLRGHGGNAWFRDPTLHVVRAPRGAFIFDSVPATQRAPASEGFQIRDVAAASNFVRIDREAFGLQLDWKRIKRDGVTHVVADIADATGRDRAVTLVYAVPVAAQSLRWLHDPRTSRSVEPGREYMNAGRFRVGGGRLSRYPLAAVANDRRGIALGIDMDWPAFYRIGYNADTSELFLAYDIALTPERPKAHVEFCHYHFDAAWGFRAALDRYYEIFPEAFDCRTPEQGLWMPFARISQVEDWEDFGFKFKEGNNETAWDDGHDIITFRYTEPMTWWMGMPPATPRTREEALAEAKRLAEEKANQQAKALFTSGYHDPDGKLTSRLLDTPWCNGAVWSMNSMPGITGEVTDFKNNWNAKLKDGLYGPGQTGGLDGEYVDSSEGYVTDELNFRRDHFAAAGTPLTFSQENHQPAIFRGSIAFEYIRDIARDVHEMDKLMMANSTPIRLCWLAPMLDVMGTETNWNPGGTWRPMSDAELLYRRALCKGKPFCFLMNTRFEDFSHKRVELYMKRALAYGMFPGFFSHNASQGHYFSRPELYNRDRPLFKKYVPLCKLVAEAGWEPITLARSSDQKVYLERFGDRYLTVFNDSGDRQTASIRTEMPMESSSRELLSSRPIIWDNGKTTLTLDPEGVAVIDLGTR
jgi:hypothetical protein